MNITPIKYNLPNITLQSRSRINQNFSGINNSKNTGKILNMLSKVRTGSYNAKDFSEIDKIIQKLLKNNTNTTVGIMLIPDEALPAFLNGKMHPLYQGLFVAVSNDYGPIESWNSALESKLVVVPKNITDSIK